MKPVVLKHEYGMMSPTWDVIPFLPLVIMQQCVFNLKAVAYELPTFVPNQYLYTTHKDKGKENWEILAWAVREVMSDAGQLPKND